nr:MAG TPA: hypothetical protein [Caudoviricetes sp.]
MLGMSLHLLLEQVAGLLVGVALKVTIHGAPGHSLVKIYFKTIEIRAVHAGELGLTAHGQPAATAHACAVDHDGVHAHHGLDVVLLGHLGDELHHHQGSDGDHFIIGLASLDKFLQSIGHKTFFTVAAVVSHHHQLVADSRKFLLKNDQILVPEAHDGVDLSALLMELLGHGIGDGASHAAADDRHLFQALGLRGTAQRTYEILERVALLQMVQLFRGGAHDLENNGHSARFPIEIRHGQGNAFPFLVHSQDDELTRLRLTGDEGGLDLHPGDGGIEHLFFHDAVHRQNSFGTGMPPEKTASRRQSCKLSPIIEEKPGYFNFFLNFFPVNFANFPGDALQLRQHSALTLQTVIGPNGDGRIVRIEGQQLPMSQLFDIALAVEGEHTHFSFPQGAVFQPLNEHDVSVFIGGLHAVAVDTQTAMGVFRHLLCGNFQPGGVVGVSQRLTRTSGNCQVIQINIGNPTLLLSFHQVGHPVVFRCQDRVYRPFSVGVQGTVLAQKDHLWEIHLEACRFAVVRIGQIVPQEIVRGGIEKLRQLSGSGKLQAFIASFIPVINGGVRDAGLQG